MAIAYSAGERAALDARASALLDECPDVGSFIRRGQGRDPQAETLVYLRVANDPAPTTLRAGEYLGLMNAATLWLRRQGVGPGDVVSLLAPNCNASSVLYWSAMSAAALQPLNLLFSRDALVAQLNAVRAKLLFVPPPGPDGRTDTPAAGDTPVRRGYQPGAASRRPRQSPRDAGPATSRGSL